MNVRAVAPQDLTPMLDLCRDHAAYEQLPFEENGQVARWGEAFFSARPRLYGWVCEEGGRLHGYMTATIDFSTWSARPFVYLDCLYLLPEARQNGNGKRLMTTLAAFAAAHGCPEIQWQTPPHNELGLGFYRKLPNAVEREKARFTWAVDGLNRETST
jgi:ribosomal protein S18 acetylase RimI-like enzyme